MQPSVREFVRGFGDEHFGLDSKIAHTLRALLSPGRLTREYLAGRRMRYVRPLRLYVSISVLFFLVLTVRGSEAGVMQLHFGPTAATTTTASSWIGQRMEQAAAKLQARGTPSRSWRLIFGWARHCGS